MTSGLWVRFGNLSKDRCSYRAGHRLWPSHHDERIVACPVETAQQPELYRRRPFRLLIWRIPANELTRVRAPI